MDGRYQKVNLERQAYIANKIHMNQPQTPKQISATGLNAAVNILNLWGCSFEQKDAILGIPKCSSLKYQKSINLVQLSKDQLERISYILNIHADLRMIFANPENQYGFMLMKNHNDFFKGARPIDLITGGSSETLFEIYKHINAIKEK